VKRHAEEEKNIKVNAAFIFVATETDKTAHRAVIETPALILNVIGVANYAEGAQVAVEMADQGVQAIELCAGFGFKSGDELFQ